MYHVNVPCHDMYSVYSMSYSLLPPGPVEYTLNHSRVVPVTEDSACASSGRSVPARSPPSARRSPPSARRSPPSARRSPPIASKVSVQGCQQGYEFSVQGCNQATGLHKCLHHSQAITSSLVLCYRNIVINILKQSCAELICALLVSSGETKILAFICRLTKNRFIESSGNYMWSRIS